MQPSTALSLYRACAGSLLSRALLWALARWLGPPGRWRERLGFPTAPRPPGPLLWCHAVSVGEGAAALPLLSELLSRAPRLNVVLTGTSLAADEHRAALALPRIALQLAPLESPQSVGRFLAHWRPSGALFIESELWPNALARPRRLALTTRRRPR